MDERIKLYEQTLEKLLSPSAAECNVEQDLTFELMQEYRSLTSSEEKNKRECLKRLEEKLEKGKSTLIGPTEKSQVIDGGALAQIFQGLAKIREAKFIESQKSLNDKAYKEKWTDMERIELLRGVVKHGERNWSMIHENFSFQSFRTPNALAYKWNQLKNIMMQDLHSIFSKSGILLSKLDWVQTYIRKLEINNRSFINPPSSGAFLGNWNSKLGTHYLPGARYSYSSKRPGYEYEGDANMMARSDSAGYKGVSSDRYTSEMQQLCASFNECITFFQPAIESGTLTPANVMQFLASKEATQIAPKYFEVHYGSKPFVPLKELNSAVSPLPNDSQNVDSKSKPSGLSEEPKPKDEPMVITPSKEESKVEAAPGEYVNLKKMFLQKKKVQIVSESIPVSQPPKAEAKIQ